MYSRLQAPTANFMAGLTRMYEAALRDGDGALRLCNRALLLARSVLGERHPRAATARPAPSPSPCLVPGSPHANPYRAEAGLFFRTNITTWCCSLAQAAHNLGALYLHKRMYERALALLEEAKGIRLHALGSDDPDSAATLHLLGTLHCQLFEWEAAREPLQEALRIRREAYGSEHSSCVFSLTELGVVELYVSDLPCNVRREGGQSLVIGGSSLVMLEGREGNPL